MKRFSILAISLLVANMVTASGRVTIVNGEIVRSARPTRQNGTAQLSIRRGTSSSISVSGTGYLDCRNMVLDGADVTTTRDGEIISNPLRSLVIQGSGKPASKKWTLEASQVVTGIRASGSGTLELVRGDSDEITGTADDNILDKLSVSLKGSELACELESGTSMIPRTPILFTVQLRPEKLALLSSLITSLTTRIKTPLSVEKLSVEITDATLTTEQDLKIAHELSLQKSGTGSLVFQNVSTKQLVIR